MNATLSTHIGSPSEAALARLGARLQLARKQRRLRQKDLAERIGRSRATVVEIEKGSAKVEIGAYVSALSALGLLDAFELIADPAFDRDAQALTFSVLDKRIRPKKSINNDF